MSNEDKLTKVVINWLITIYTRIKGNHYKIRDCEN